VTDTSQEDVYRAEGLMFKMLSYLRYMPRARSLTFSTEIALSKQASSRITHFLAHIQAPMLSFTLHYNLIQSSPIRLL